MTGLVHHKHHHSTLRAGGFGSRGRAALSAIEAEGLSSKHFRRGSGEGPLGGCASKGVGVRGRTQPNHHRPIKQHICNAHKQHGREEGEIEGERKLRLSTENEQIF